MLSKYILSWNKELNLDYKNLKKLQEMALKILKELYKKVLKETLVEIKPDTGAEKLLKDVNIKYKSNQS